MSLNAVAIRHVPFEDLGILAPILAERGYSVQYLDAGIDAIDAATLGNAQTSGVPRHRGIRALEPLGLELAKNL